MTNSKNQEKGVPDRISGPTDPVNPDQNHIPSV